MGTNGRAHENAPFFCFALAEASVFQAAVLRSSADSGGSVPETPNAAKVHEEKETGRLEAFSDGVFAIAITLLVLELKVPELSQTGGSPAALAKALLQQWPSYLGLVTSFFTVLIMWVHHHAILRNVCRTDAWLHFANGCLLLGVTFVPYPSSILARYLETPAAKMAMVFYAGTFVFMAICFYLFIPETAPIGERVDGLCGQDLPRVHVWAAFVLSRDAGGADRRSAFARYLYAVVDLLGNNDHQEHPGVRENKKSLILDPQGAPKRKPGSISGRWRRVGRSRCAFR